GGRWGRGGGGGEGPAGGPGGGAGRGPAAPAVRAPAVLAGDGLAGPGGESRDGPADGQPEPGWRLEFLLQSVADPSLLIDAEQTWADDGTLSRGLPRPPELLIAEPGPAGRRYPERAGG